MLLLTCFQLASCHPLQAQINKQSLYWNMSSGNEELHHEKPLVSDLPLTVFEPAFPSPFPLFVFITGDGGCNSFSNSLCKLLSSRGIPVVALDARKYFWNGRTPEKASEDLELLISHYSQSMRKKNFVLAGFSFGAGVVPFLINRFPEKLASDISCSLLISPDTYSDLEIHLSDMLNLGISRGKYNVVREIHPADAKKIIIIVGSDENKSTVASYQLAGVRILTLAGDHHFDNDFEVLAHLIVEVIERESAISKFP